MEKMKKLIETVSQTFERLAGGNAAVAKPISFGNRHVLPLCELSVAWAAAEAEGEGEGDDKGRGQGGGKAGGGGGGAKANPVALVVIEDGKVRLESLG